MAIRMQQRRGTLSQWAAANPVLAAGEIGWESDTNKFKLGDGVNQWSNLDYFTPIDPDGPSLEDYVPLNAVGEPGGVASLDENGQVPASQLGNATVDLSSYATQTYVDTAVSGLVDAAPGLLDTLNELAAAIGDDANFVTTVNAAITNGDAATLSAAEDYADGLAVNYDAAGSAAAAQTAAETFATNAINALDTDDIEEGATNLYFSNARAVEALEAVVPDFVEVDINSVATQVAASVEVLTASTVTAYEFDAAQYRSAKFLVKFASGTHTEISEVLLTLDTSDNIAITEYALVGTNGNLGNVTADVNAGNVRLRVATVNNNTDVVVMGTLLV